MTQKEIVALIKQKESEIETLTQNLKDMHPIQPMDKVKVTERSKVIYGMCISLIFDGEEIEPIIFPLKKDGTVSKNGRIFIWDDTKIEKI